MWCVASAFDCSSFVGELARADFDFQRGVKTGQVNPPINPADTVQVQDVVAAKTDGGFSFLRFAPCNRLAEQTLPSLFASANGNVSNFKRASEVEQGDLKLIKRQDGPGGAVVVVSFFFPLPASFLSGALNSFLLRLVRSILQST